MRGPTGVTDDVAQGRQVGNRSGGALEAGIAGGDPPSGSAVEDDLIVQASDGVEPGSGMARHIHAPVDVHKAVAAEEDRTDVVYSVCVRLIIVTNQTVAHEAVFRMDCPNAVR